MIIFKRYIKLIMSGEDMDKICSGQNEDFRVTDWEGLKITVLHVESGLEYSGVYSHNARDTVYLYNVDDTLGCYNENIT